MKKSEIIKKVAPCSLMCHTCSAYTLSLNELVDLSVISVSDWLVGQQIDDTRLIGYLQSLLDEGCLMSITKDVIDYMSLEVSKKDSDSKQRMYLMWDNLLGRVDNFPDKQKAVFIQAMSEVFASYIDYKYTFASKTEN